MKMEIGAMALCSLGAATAFVTPTAFHGSQLARPQQATSGKYVMSSLKPYARLSLSKQSSWWCHVFVVSHAPW